MKKVICILLTALVLTMLCACSDSASSKLGSGTDTVGDLLANGGDTAATASKETEAAASAPAADLSTDVDVDLTVLSSTMVFSEVQNMLQQPDDYLGKSVRMRGDFAVAKTEDQIYYACLIRDATACCANGIEFLWKGDHSYPEDYPDDGDEITVVGTFNKYYEGDQLYIQLTDAELSF